MARELIPEWGGFVVAKCALYLGAWLWPTLGDQQWAAAISKLASRAKAIANAPSSCPIAAASLYNSRALPVVSFLAQLFFPHALVELNMLERRMLSMIFKFPFTGISQAGFLNLHRWGGVEAKSLEVTMLVSLMRSVSLTLSSWRTSALEL